MSAVAYDYALLRVVPRVHLGDGETVAAVLHARRAGYLGVALAADPDAVAARWASLDAALLARYLDAFAGVLGGGVEVGPIGLLPASERFHWATATRSTVLQPGPVRTGADAVPAEALRRLAADAGLVMRE